VRHFQVGSLVVVGSIVAEVRGHEIHDGEQDFLLVPVDPNQTFCSGYACKGVDGGCRDCDGGVERSNWFRASEITGVVHSETR